MNETAVLVYVYAIVPAATLFPIWYAFQPWWRSHIGRALMAHGLGTLLLFDLTALSPVLPEHYPGEQIVGFAILTFYAIGTWYLLYAAIAGWWEGRRAEP